MSIMKVIHSRRSIRRFTDDDVSPECVEQLLEAAIWAPSAGNVQPWRFYVIKSARIKEQLSRAAYDQHFINEAPSVIAVCVDCRASSQAYGDRGKNLYCLMDAGAAIQNLLLMVHERGLGACWVSAFDEEKVANILESKPDLRPVALVPIGHPAEIPTAPLRKRLNEVVRFIL